jgi:hypothetical protein
MGRMDGTILAVRDILWPAAPWDKPAPAPLSPHENLLWAFWPWISATLLPLHYKQFRAHGLWGQESHLRACCLRHNMGARHECVCQIPRWIAYFNIIARGSLFTAHINLGRNAIEILREHRLVLTISAIPTTAAYAHSYALVPRHEFYWDISTTTYLVHQIAEPWAHTIRKYAAECAFLRRRIVHNR